MKGSDKAIVFGVLMAIVLGIFYVKVLSPKREEASKLGMDISDLKAQVAQEEQVAQFGEQARHEFPAFYGRLVVLGKAVPAQADTSSLLVELSGISRHSGVDFTGITLGSSSGSSSASSSSSSQSSTGTTPSSGASTTGSSTTASPAATAPVVPTEASAASLPIGATIGPDNLAVMPYSLEFSGSYFQVADFLKGLDDLIHVHGTTTVAADGRLLTVNGFTLDHPNGNSSSPTLSVSVDVTSYVTPASEGLTAGASPTGPAPSVTTTPTQTASATVSP
jgi:Tfp pilus assembly protein PilO